MLPCSDFHPALTTLAYVNPYTEDHKAGSHAFRRFRNTHLKNETSCPKGLRDYWLGHKGDSMDDLYEVKHNMALRKKWSAECGAGTNSQPQWRRMYRKNAGKLNTRKLRKLLNRREKDWSGREDLNLRPPGPEPGALPG